MKRIVHYLNQFYGQIGGEEFADQEPILREGIVGPGTGLQAVLGEKAEIVATIICGDNYFADDHDRGTGAGYVYSGSGVQCGALWPGLRNYLR